MVEKRAQKQLDGQDVRVECWDLLEVLFFTQKENKKRNKSDHTKSGQSS